MLKFDTLMKRCVRNKKKHCVKCILEIWKTENSKSKKKKQTNKQKTAIYPIIDFHE